MNRTVRTFLAAAAVGAMFATTPATAERRVELTPMQLQALQSKEFEAGKETLFGAVMTVLQDLGYQVESADLQTGFINAASLTENRTNFFEALGGGRSQGQTRMTAFVQQLPNGRSRVRLNFLFSRMSSSAYGQSARNDRPVLDAAVYNNAWERIDEALFVVNSINATESAPSSTATLAPTEPQSSATPSVEPGTTASESPQG